MNILEIMQTVGISAVGFIVVLSILVFVHEWGHYIVARMCGVKVETFSIGFGKELFGRYDKNGTRWKFAMIPLGGYVKLFGDVDPASAGHADGVEEEGAEAPRPFTEAERRQAFFSQPVWKRALVVIAGPAINYIFAIILFTGLFVFNGQPVTPPVAAAVVGGSSADENGFQAHDRIVSIDGNKIRSFEDIRREMMIALDEKKHFIVERNGEQIDIHASPKKETFHDRFGFPHSRGVLGLISPRHAMLLEMIGAVDGEPVANIDEARDAISARMGQSFPITIIGGEEDQILHIQPSAEYNSFLNTPDADESKFVFLSSVEVNQFVKHSFFTAVYEAIDECWVVTRGTLDALGQMIVGTRSATELGGLTRIAAMAGDMAKQGIIPLILFTALLSINLGLINLFPIPMLDGGHLVFYAFEAVLGKPIPERVQEYAFRVGFVFLIGIMVFANLNDLIQLFI